MGNRASMELDTVVCADALEFLRGLAAESVDLVVTSPPYNMGTQINGAKPCSKSNSNWGKSALLANGYDTVDDAMSHEDYIRWQRDILAECYRVIRDTGAIFYNHKWRIQGGLLDRKADQIVEGLPVRQIIIWDRGSGNNHNRAFFAPQYEVIYLIAKLAFYIHQAATKHSDLWVIAPETGTKHPAPFPLVLAERVIQSTSAQVILDPFMGRGTTAKAAQRLGRHYIGCDISQTYVDEARRWLAEPVPLPLLPHEPEPAGVQLGLFGGDGG